MEELRPGVEFKMSKHCFDRFKSRYEVSLRRTLSAAETVWYTLRTFIQQFTDFSEERQQLKQPNWGVSAKEAL